MNTHTVTYVASTTDQTFPSGTTIGPTVATLSTGATVINTVNLDTTGTAVFILVPDGDYVLSVQATDASGAPLGAPYAVSVKVSDPVVTVKIPTGGTVTIS